MFSNYASCRMPSKTRFGWLRRRHGDCAVSGHNPNITFPCGARFDGSFTNCFFANSLTATSIGTYGLTVRRSSRFQVGYSSTDACINWVRHTSPSNTAIQLRTTSSN